MQEDKDRDLEHQRLAALVESSDDAIISKDLDGTVRSWNPAAERIFGYTGEEMIGQPVFRLIPPELHEEERSILRRIAAGEHVTSFETTRLRKDGRRITIALTVSPLRDAQGRLVGASSIKRDITAQRKLEAQFRQVQKMDTVGRLAGGVAHDFNNLLTVIGGMASLLLEQLPRGSEEREEVEEIAGAAHRARYLTRHLLAFSRRQPSSPRVLDLNQLVRQSHRLLERLIGEDIDLRILPSAAVDTVEADPGMLEQVIMNLAVNARDAMPEGGSLTIETRRVVLEEQLAAERLELAPGAYVMLAVSDTGMGMDAITQASIFEPFFTTKPVGKGTGLGLSTVYGIVQQHGGGIYVYSEQGQGTTFKVYLPQAGGEPEPAAPKARVLETLTGRGTILLVEDDPGVRNFALRVLSGAGYRVLVAAMPEEAMSLADRTVGALDLLITDVVMPGLTGRELAARLQHSRPDLPVLFMSGYTDEQVLRRGTLTSGASFLGKPFAPRDLLERVSQILRVERVKGER